MHEREADDVSLDGPVSNAAVAGEQADTPEAPALMSLSLRNKNKAKNFKSLMSKPLAPKIIFGDEDAAPAPPRLIPPSLRSSLPPNMTVTSVDVEAGLHRETKRGKVRVKYGDEFKGPPGQTSFEMDIGIMETMADKYWDTLEKLTGDKLAVGTIVGYKVRLPWVRVSTG
jgi:hypothetical protein